MINAIIIDDERSGIITLEKELAKIDGVQVLASVQDSRTAKEQITTLAPDIVFLDIEMPYLNGFQLLDQFDTLPFKVIFVTAYNQFAIKAFKYNALDYLLKPVDAADLNLCIQNYRNNEIHNTQAQLSELKKVNVLPDTIALSTSQGLSFVKTQDIAYLEADNCYTHIFLKNGQKHLLSKSLVNFDFILEDHPVFFKAHKSFIINLQAVVSYVRGEGGEIIMFDNKSIPLSRNKKQAFLSLFHKV